MHQDGKVEAGAPKTSARKDRKAQTPMNCKAAAWKQFVHEQGALLERNLFWIKRQVSTTGEDASQQKDGGRHHERSK